MEEKILAGVQVEGAFNARRFFETLAIIISNKENLSVTVTVHGAWKEREKAATA